MKIPVREGPGGETGGGVRHTVSNISELIGKMPDLLGELNNKDAFSREEFKKPLPCTKDNPEGVPDKGVYAFYENDKVMYIGRSNHLRERVLQYGKSFNPIGFVRKLMESELGEQIIPNITCKELKEKYPGGFYKAKKRIQKMLVRFIKIEDQKEQALFEVYAAIALDSKCNKYETH